MRKKPAAVASPSTPPPPAVAGDPYECSSLAQELSLDADTVADLRSAFQAFEVGSSKVGSLPLSDALLLLRACGERVSHTDLLRAHPPDGALSFAAFVRRTHRRLSRPTRAPAQLHAALRCFERKDGEASFEELRRELACAGEPLPQAEADAFARDAGADRRTGTFSSAAFVAKLSAAASPGPVK